MYMYVYNNIIYIYIVLFIPILVMSGTRDKSFDENFIGQ